MAAHVDGVAEVLCGQEAVRRTKGFSSQIVVRVRDDVAVLVEAEVRLIIGDLVFGVLIILEILVLVQVGSGKRTPNHFTTSQILRELKKRENKT